VPRVSRVSVLQVGRVRVRPDNVAGTWRPMLWWTVFSRAWTGWLPVNVVVVEHDRGVLLVDTGQSRASMKPGYHPGGLLGWAYRRQAEFVVDADDDLAARLAGLGLTPADVDTVVLTHLHQDHAGNVGLLPHARVLVSADELSLLDESRPAAHGVLPEHVAPPSVTFTPVRPTPLSTPVGPFTTGTDLYDDGTLVLLPTPGHSRGSQSLLVRRPDADPLLVVGDLTYDPSLLAAERVPGTGATGQQRASTRAVNALVGAEPGLRVIAAHDPAAADRASGGHT
jgi:N-acyl homoserine lactone hydrolase